jgi:hypothetical protein
MTISESCLAENSVIARTPMHQQMFALVGKQYCPLFHSSISLPVPGRYRCWKCLREFAIEW